MKTRILFLLLFAFNYTMGQQSNFAGTYQFDMNPLKIFTVKADKEAIYFCDNGNNYIKLKPLGENRYSVDNISPEVILQFVPGKMIINQGGKDYDCQKLFDEPDLPKAKSSSNRQNGFTRADTLRGKLTSVRDCYDVTYYHLTVEIQPDRRWLEGNVLIRFNTVKPFSELQVDLYENMPVDSILYNGKLLSYKREYDAVFVQFPEMITPGISAEIRVYYHGQPQEPDQSVSMNGGVLWRKDANGKNFSQVVCQGSGASVWWPNKDHLSDGSDSTLITVIVPSGLKNISNGRLRKKMDLPGKRVLTEWFVSYPINNYNVTFNIGDYTHFSDTYGSLTLDYYYLAGHFEQAKRLSAKVKPMLVQFEKCFGPYPFPRDGFKIIETLYPMEHQSAVALGSLLGDSTELERLMWHEIAHEWWGNNISMKDFADFWLHEGPAVYSEKLMIELKSGQAAALKSIASETPGNKENLIGEYDVNHVFYNLGDVYSKGSRLMHTLRSVINDDQLFFDILRGIQKDFAYQTVNSKDIETYISKKSGIDFASFFNQYLRTTKIPKLTYVFHGGELRYKWTNTIPGFNMPIRVTVKGRDEFIRPTNKWQSIGSKGLNEKDFKVDTLNFYIE
jgi:aminopeptidase N